MYQVQAVAGGRHANAVVNCDDTRLKFTGRAKNTPSASTIPL